MTAPGDPILLEECCDGGFWHARIDRPNANILDKSVVLSLTEVFSRARENPDLKAVCVSGVGDHFSFGASVEEHQPEQVAGMLSTFHRMFRTMADTPVTLLAAVRGQCLGGGLELASFCHRVFASQDAKLGQPEIQLGVIAPVASVILRERVGSAAAEDLCITGRILGAQDAHTIGLVDELVDDPAQAAFRYFEEHLQRHSASSLRFALRAVRRGFYERFVAELQTIEELYLEELQSTHDAVEGIQAFLEKRKPQWSNS